MKYRKLRIAFSALCGVLCLLLIVLWVRSYYGLLVARGDVLDSFYYSVYSALGAVDVAFAPPTLDDPTPHEIRWISISPAEIFDVREANEKTTNQSDTVLGFGIYPNRSGFTIRHWLLILLTGALAAAPWLRCRFSLRTLLIGMTLVAVVLGLIIYAAR